MYMFMTKTTRLHQDENGFASIVIALVLIVVLALLTVGFAQLSRREQQSALDSQLATQASYAAETGVNDIYNAIAQDGITTSTTNVGTSNCLQFPLTYVVGGQSHTIDNTINSTDGVSYTCALVNLTPPTLVKNPVNTGTTWDTVFSTTGSLGSLKVTWSSADGHTGSPPGSIGDSPPDTFPPVSGWGNAPPVLELSLTPLGDGTGLTSSSLIDNTFTVYLYPEGSGTNSVHYYPETSSSSPSQTGTIIISGNCSSGVCSSTVDSLNGAAGEYYLMRIFDLPYDQANISTSATSTSGTALDFTDSQAVIDVTGHAKNVLKRLREVLSINGIGDNPGNNNDSLPGNALQAQNICKRFDTAPYDSTNNPNGTTYHTGTSSSCSLSQ